MLVAQRERQTAAPIRSASVVQRAPAPRAREVARSPANAADPLSGMLARAVAQRAHEAAGSDCCAAWKSGGSTDPSSVLPPARDRPVARSDSPPAARAGALAPNVLREHHAALGNRGLARLARTAAEPGAELPAPDVRRVIRQGSRGAEVSYAQERLNAHDDAGLTVDAIFGPLTKQATRGYQRTHGLVADAIIGRRTWASLDGPTSIRISGSGSGSGGGGKGSTVLLYQIGPTAFTPPPPGFGMKDVPHNVKAEQASGDLGPTVSVHGVKSDSTEEIYLWNILLQQADAASWASEHDAIAQIGPAAPPAAAPLGRVTIRIDGSGNTEAVLHGMGGPAALTTFKDVKAAKEALITTFGIKAVVDGAGSKGAKWTLDELNKVFGALSLLPKEDISALAGIELKRVATLAGGLTGKFTKNVDAKGKPTVFRIDIANKAFDYDTTSFIGDATNARFMSFATILHEVGHAVEAHEGGPTTTKRLQAFVDFVTAEKIPPLTAYSRDNWPADPGEFFAEAYTLWLNDPEYLDSEAPKLKKWFDDGKHRV